MGENRMFQGDLEGVTLIDLLGTMSKDDRLIESFPRYAQIKSSTVTGHYKNQSVLPSAVRVSEPGRSFTTDWQDMQSHRILNGWLP